MEGVNIMANKLRSDEYLAPDGQVKRCHKQDVPDREMIMGDTYTQPWSDTGLRRFENLTALQIESLLVAGLIDPEETQNDSPTTVEFLDFMNNMKEKYGVTVFAHGYTVEWSRDDTRVTLEGLSLWKKPRGDLRKAWFEFNKDAEELDDKRSWWD